ncbi:hypothetical protein LH462_06795 [Laribacter hongkongensis]|uniref:Uncharacterized protein n=1 Tax=Laribacter hongkongensis TaxID=168471 RepID=A0ABD4SPR4_9NEIS|nr:hypothetical protein [Laribacter hongkongensis]MCG9025182.1 hypothetical protein [Laribacter hongkongensis]MCG9099770.1 hypothetical protein [Laribacter hongkongensis]MCG9103428.1 hypothetical protein [Laribacter hongkongensis]MCG9111248.1 hypothetical protein [Laribacter hongkongensis]MCG9118596.1 hypothetical protein [Laribacter hongkongensis]
MASSNTRLEPAGLDDWLDRDSTAGQKIQTRAGRDKDREQKRLKRASCKAEADALYQVERSRWASRCRKLRQKKQPGSPPPFVPSMRLVRLYLYGCGHDWPYIKAALARLRQQREAADEAGQQAGRDWKTALGADW